MKTDTLVRYLPSETKREKKQIVIDETLEVMAKKHKSVTAELLVQEASSPAHPLHRFFEWDDTKAAQKYRLDQAFAMIIASRFTVQLVERKNTTEKVLKSCRVRRLVNSFSGEGFKMRKDALGNAEDRGGIIEKKKSALRSWCKSVVDIEELNELRETIEKQLGE